MAAPESNPGDAKKKSRRGRNARYYASHREEMIDRAARYAAENAQARKDYRLRHYRDNRESLIKKSVEWGKENPDKKRVLHAQYYERHSAELSEKHARRREDPAYRVRKLLISARGRAKKFGFAFDDSLLSELLAGIPSACPCCGTPFVYAGRHHMRAPSIDRVDNADGYTLPNTRIICYRCNTLKSDASLEEVEAILAYMRFKALRG